MEYTKGKNIISKLMKSAISIGIFIVLVITIPYIAIFVIRALFFIAVFGVLAWYGFKLVKTIKNCIYKIRTKNDATIKADISSNDTFTADSIDINYEDNTIIDVDYEKVD
ncbi:hypothetical protein K9O30_00135 [Clostridium bowmanii]|uniref:hypothetical protein n=1 Tax=Clostridium bowmanii TaxID=132925 RepID=UPI001C0C4A9E|nr:hypothetical protein [Clostridium bowmanii]MBU3188001.1 hypothetical protein [Clostridium bowmanii]MCA1072180.1 hypothetical protein [Clostridium bowmanii]